MGWEKKESDSREYKKYEGGRKIDNRGERGESKGGRGIR